MDGSTGPRPSAGSSWRPVLAWGVPDAVTVWVVGLLGGIVGSVVATTARGLDADETVDDPVVFTVGVLAQFGATIAALVWVSRAKGRGTLGADFGLRLQLRDAWLVPVGLLVQIGIGALLWPISLLDDTRQGVVEQIDRAGGLELAVLALTAGVLAPVVEEVLFRGLLLRALLRRASPTVAVLGSSLVFGAVHLVDPDALAVVPGLTALGVVAALLAVRTGSLSQPIWLHAGFNGFVVVGALVG